jgi:hypothetical protein
MTMTRRSRARRRRRLIVTACVVLALLLAGLGWLFFPRSTAPDDRFTSHRGALLETTITDREVADGWVTESIVLTDTRGMEVRALIQVPETVTAPLPALVLLGGFRTGRDVVRHVPPAIPCIRIGLDYQVEKPDPETAWAYVRGVPRFRRDADRSVAAAWLALDYLESRPEVDPERTILVGGSLGAFFAAVAGALDPRFDGVALLFAGADIGRIVEANLPWTGWRRSAALLFLRPWMDPVDPARFVGRIAPRPLLVVGTPDDPRVPRDCVEVLAEAGGESTRLAWVTTPHEIQGDADAITAVADTLLDWMRDHGLVAGP